MTERTVIRRHLLPHATFGDDPSGWCGCAGCEPRATCWCQSCRETYSPGQSMDSAPLSHTGDCAPNCARVEETA